MRNKARLEGRHKQQAWRGCFVLSGHCRPKFFAGLNTLRKIRLLSRWKCFASVTGRRSPALPTKEAGWML